DHKVGHGAVTLAGYLGCAISLQLDVTSQDDLNRAIHAAMAFWEGRLGLVGNLADCVTPGCASRIVWYRLAVEHVIPGNFCYNSHRSIPLSEGLTVGRVTRCLAAWVTRPCCFCPLRYFSRLRFLPACGRTLHPLRSLRDLAHFRLLALLSPTLQGIQDCQ